MTYTISLDSELKSDAVDALHDVCQGVEKLRPPVDLRLDLSRVESAGAVGMAALGARLRRWKQAGQCDPMCGYVPPARRALHGSLGPAAMSAVLGDRAQPRAGASPNARGVEAFTDRDGVYEAVQGLQFALLQQVPLAPTAIVSVGTMIEEICRNVIQHGDRHGGVAAVASVASDRFELAVCDLGMGVQASLAQNPDYAGVDNVSALRSALDPGVSGTPGPARGMGLFLARLVLAENGGLLTLRSGGVTVACAPDATTAYASPWMPGTLFTAEVRIDHAFDYGRVDETLSQASGVPSGPQSV